MGSLNDTRLAGLASGKLGLKRTGVEEPEGNPLSLELWSLPVGDSSAMDKRRSVDDELRERIEGSEIFARVLSMAAAANAKIPPGFCVLVGDGVLLPVEEVNWCAGGLFKASVLLGPESVEGAAGDDNVLDSLPAVGAREGF